MLEDKLSGKIAHGAERVFAFGAVTTGGFLTGYVLLGGLAELVGCGSFSPFLSVVSALSCAMEYEDIYDDWKHYLTVELKRDALPEMKRTYRVAKDLFAEGLKWEKDIFCMTYDVAKLVFKLYKDECSKL